MNSGFLFIILVRWPQIVSRFSGDEPFTTNWEAFALISTVAGLENFTESLPISSKPDSSSVNCNFFSLDSGSGVG